MSKKLLPCPFCGGEAEIERMGTRRQSCQVACTNCGARHEGPDQDEHSGDSWNRRAAFDGQWQSERPAAGEWWVAIHPDQRAGCKKTVYEVWVTGADEVITRTNCVHRLQDDIFTGALWQRRTVPADPFAKGGGE